MTERLTDAELAEYVDEDAHLGLERMCEHGLAAARELQEARKALYRVLEVPRHVEAGAAVDVVLEFFEKYPVLP